jgi:hypothetical protein
LKQHLAEKELNVENQSKEVYHMEIWWEGLGVAYVCFGGEKG